MLSNEASPTQDPTQEGNVKLIEVTINLAGLRKDGQDTATSLREASQHFRNPVMAFVLNSLLSQMEQESDEAQALKARLSEANSCSYVYWGCGSCSGGRARVDAYCDDGGTGGSPDYSWCEAC